MRLPKVFSLLLVFVVFSSAKPATRKDEMAAGRFQVNLNLCKEKAGASTEDIQDLLDRKPPSGMTGKCMRACLMKKYKVMDSNGKFDEVAALAEARKLTNGDPGKMKLAHDLTNVCGNIEVPSDHCEAAAVYGHCFREEMRALGLVKS